MSGPIKDVTGYLEKYILQHGLKWPVKDEFLGGCTPGFLRIFPEVDLITCLNVEDGEELAIDPEVGRDQFPLNFGGKPLDNPLANFIDRIIQTEILPEISASDLSDILLSKSMCNLDPKDALSATTESIKTQIIAEAMKRFGDNNIFIDKDSNTEIIQNVIFTTTRRNTAQEFTAIFDDEEQAKTFVKSEFFRFLGDQIERCLLQNTNNNLNPEGDPLAFVFTLAFRIKELQRILDRMLDQIQLISGSLQISATCNELGEYQRRAQMIFNQLRIAMGSADLTPGQIADFQNPDFLSDPDGAFAGVSNAFKSIISSLGGGIASVVRAILRKVFLSDVNPKENRPVEDILAEDLLLLAGGTNTTQLIQGINRHAGLKDTLDRFDSTVGKLPVQVSGLVQRVWILWQRAGCDCDGGLNSVEVSQEARQDIDERFKQSPDEIGRCTGIRVELDGINNLLNSILTNIESQDYSCAEFFRDLESLNSGRFTAQHNDGPDRIALPYAPLWMRRKIELARSLLEKRRLEGKCFELNANNPDTRDATLGGRGQTQDRFKNGDGYSFNRLKALFDSYRDYSPQSVGARGFARNSDIYCDILRNIYNNFMRGVFTGWDADGIPICSSKKLGSSSMITMVRTELLDLLDALNTGCTTQGPTKTGEQGACCEHANAIRAQDIENGCDSVFSIRNNPIRRPLPPPDFIEDFLEITQADVDAATPAVDEQQPSIEQALKEIPTAQFTIEPIAPLVGEQVTYDASESKAKSGETIDNYIWFFGDGGKRQGADLETVTHTYSSAQTFKVKLQVIDSRGFGSLLATQDLIVEAKSGLSELFDEAGLRDPELRPARNAGDGQWIINLVWGPLAGPYSLRDFRNKVIDPMITRLGTASRCGLVQQIADQLLKPLIGIGGPPASIFRETGDSSTGPVEELEVGSDPFTSSRNTAVLNLGLAISNLQASIQVAAGRIFEETQQRCDVALNEEPSSDDKGEVVGSQEETKEDKTEPPSSVNEAATRRSEFINDLGFNTRPPLEMTPEQITESQSNNVIVLSGTPPELSGSFDIFDFLNWMQNLRLDVLRATKSGPPNCPILDSIVLRIVAPIVGRSPSTQAAKTGSGLTFNPPANGTIRTIVNLAQNILEMASKACNDAITFQNDESKEKANKRFVLPGRDAMNVALGKQRAVVLPTALEIPIDELVVLAGEFDDETFDLAEVRFKGALPISTDGGPDIWQEFHLTTEPRKRELYGNAALSVRFVTVETRLFEDISKLKPIEFANVSQDEDPLDELTAQLTPKKPARVTILKPGQHYVPPKPAKVKRDQLTTKDNFIKLIGDRLPGFYNVKHDGMRFVLHIWDNGRRLNVFTASDKGFSILDQLPFWESRFRMLPFNDAIIDGEFEMWVDGKKQPRSEVSANILDKELVDDDLLPNFFDIVWANGNDLSDKPVEERIRVLNQIVPPNISQRTVGIPEPSKINITPFIPINSLSEALSIFDKLMELPHIEGIVFKQKGSPYEINLDRAFKPWAKYHRSITVQAMVLQRIGTKLPNLFVYEMGVPFGPNIDPVEDFRLNGVRFMKVGKSIPTGTKLEPGEIIIIETDQVILEEFDREGTIKFRMVSPKVINKKLADLEMKDFGQELANVIGNWAKQREGLSNESS